MVKYGPARQQSVSQQGELKLTREPRGTQPAEKKSSFIVFEDRASDSPFVEKIWRCHSERADSFLSVAACHFEMAVTRLRGKTFITLRGPETKATTLDCPAEGEWLGIRFKLVQDGSLLYPSIVLTEPEHSGQKNKERGYQWGRRLFISKLWAERAISSNGSTANSSGGRSTATTR